MALPRSALSLSKTGSPQPSGDAGGDQFADAADRVALAAERFDQFDHSLSGSGVGAADDVAFDLFHCIRALLQVILIGNQLHLLLLTGFGVDLL